MSGFSHFHRVLTLSGRTQFLSWLAVLFLGLSMVTTNIAFLPSQVPGPEAPIPRAETSGSAVSINVQRELSPSVKQRNYTSEALDGSASSPDEASVLQALVALWPILELEPDKASYLPDSAETHQPLLRHALSPRAPPMS